MANTDPILFNPDSSGMATWDILGLFFIIYQAIIIPFRLCYGVEPTGFWFFVESTIDICFMVDILVQFNVGFIKRGNLIQSRSAICCNYVQGWFFIDLFASFPYGWVFGTDP